MSDNVNNPPHYGGADNLYEAIKVVEAWNLGFHLGNTLKYISRAGKKTEDTISDLKKAKWYLDRKISLLEMEKEQKEEKVKSNSRPNWPFIPHSSHSFPPQKDHCIHCRESIYDVNITKLCGSGR